jgi:hypothetical protein
VSGAREGRLPKALFAAFFRSLLFRSLLFRSLEGLLLLGLLCAGLPGAARAQAPDPVRILVLEGPTPDWVRRVRGQLSDLPVSIATLALVVEGQPEPELLRQLRPLAEHRDAALVAWLITERGEVRGAVGAGSTRVGIWFARSGRFFSRPLGGAWTQLSAADRSGVLELGALSVRSALRSLLLDPAQAEPLREPAPAAPSAALVAPSGAPSSPSASSRASSSTPNAVTAPSTAPHGTAPPPAAPPNAGTPNASLSVPAAAASADPATRAAAAEPLSVGSAPSDAVLPQDGPIVTSPGARALPTDAASNEPGAASGLALDLHWSAELGAVGQMPGPPAYGALGLAAGLRAQSGAWAALLIGQLGMPLRSKLGPTQVEVLQHALLTQGQYLRWNTGAWSFGPLVRAGVRWARRETVAGDPGLAASGVKWQPALRLGLGWTTELRWSTRFGATLRGVLHWEPARPSYAVLTTTGDPVANAQPWAVQPSLEIGGNWYW